MNAKGSDTDMNLSTHIQALRKTMHYLSDEERSKVEEAIEITCAAHEGQTRQDGTPYCTHPIGVATILAEWGADMETLIAGLLHDTLEDTQLSYPEISDAFWEEVAWLVEGVTKFTKADFEGQESLDRKIETLRKLLDVMRQDIRVVIIKLADRLHNVRTINDLPPKRRARFAQETLDVYYNLAQHLGMNNVRRELSQHCFVHVFPEENKKLEKKRQFWEQIFHDLPPIIERAIQENDTSGALVSLRPELRSFTTMQKFMGTDRSDEPSYVLVAIAKNTDSCYDVLKALHTKFTPVSGRFRDFIASPTESAYQSLRTTVIGPNGNMIPVRIRTADMDEQEHKGVLLKCFGKQKKIPGFSWLVRSESLDQSTRESSQAFWEALQSDILQVSINITIDGEQLSIPAESSALDAVYAKYGAEANRTFHITVNGTHVQIGHMLEEDDIVGVKLHGHESVQFEWLDAVHTNYARNLIVGSLKKRGQNEKITIGQRLLQREFDHFKLGLIGELSKARREEACTHYERTNFEEVLSLIGEGMIVARDIVFLLFPEHEGASGRKAGSTSSAYDFSLQMRGTLRQRLDPLSQALSLARIHDITTTGTDMKKTQYADTVQIRLSGQAPSRLQFANFLNALGTQEWITDIQTLLSPKRKLSFLLTVLFALSIMVADIVFLPTYIHKLTVLPNIVAAALPLVLILLVAHMILRYCQQHIVFMRQEQWFLGLGFFVNILGTVLILWRYISIKSHFAILPVLLIFSMAMIALVMKYVQAMFFLEERTERKQIAKAQWQHHTKQKVIGYMLRFFAVCIWGLFPVFVRYSPLQTLSPLMRVNIWAISGALCGYAAIAIINLLQRKREKLSYTTPINRYFWIIVISNISYNYFLHKSLQFTAATNVNLVMSYAPIFSLLIAFVIWRKHIPYFHSAKSVQQMLAVFALSAVGGTFLVYNDLLQSPNSVLGDFFALLIAVSDVAFIMTNIYYIKYSKTASNTLALSAQHLFYIAIVTFFMIRFANLGITEPILYSDLTTSQWLHNITVGVLAMAGFVLTFEAFKRIDGLIAFLLFNLTPVIAFIPEYLFYDFRASPMFLLGALCIIVSSVLAETINSKSEREEF